MQSTGPAASLATVSSSALSTATLRSTFTAIPDPRRIASVRYPLDSLLALIVSALLANQHSVLAIAEWATWQSDAVLGPLGLSAGHTPCQSTLQRLLVKLDAAAVSAP